MKPAPASYPLPQRIVLFLAVTVIGTLADLGSKAWMFAQQPLRDLEIWWVVPEYAGFQLSLNAGALAGIGQGKVWLFATLSVLFAIAIPIWLFRFGAAADLHLTLLLGCVMAGVLGNLYDRLGLHGETWFYDPQRAGERAYAVRDFILLQWDPQHRWPNFNIADSLLVVAAGALAVKTLLEKPPQSESPGSDARDSAAVGHDPEPEDK
jgi:signal peptidase II